MGFGATTKTEVKPQNFHDLTSATMPNNGPNYKGLLQKEHESRFKSAASATSPTKEQEYQVTAPQKGFVSKISLNQGVVTFEFEGSNYAEGNARISIKLEPEEGLKPGHIETLKSVIDRGAANGQNKPFATAEDQINVLLHTLGYINGEPTTQDLSDIKITGLAIRGLKGGHYIMDGAELDNVLIEQSDLKGSSHIKAKWQGVVVKDNDLGGADLSGAKADKDSVFENNCLNDAKLNMTFQGKGFKGNIGLNAELPRAVVNDLKNLLQQLEKGGNRKELKNIILQKYTGLTFEKEGEFVEIAALLKKHKLLVKPKQLHEERGWDSFKKQLEQDGLHVFKEKIGSDEIFKVIMPNEGVLAFKKGQGDSLQFVREHSTTDLGAELDLEKVRLSKLWGAIMQRQRESQFFVIADAEETTAAKDTQITSDVKKEDGEALIIEDSKQRNETLSSQPAQQEVEDVTGVIDVYPTDTKEEWCSTHYVGLNLPKPDQEG